jgi:hypothetical protein
MSAMHTSARGRSARRGARRHESSIIDRLEPRQLLAVTTLKDFGGLPRELTAVGSFVYFALDEKADGRLSYVDLIRYDPKRNKIVKIYKSDGSKFGKVRYFLSEANDKLVIRERLSDTASQYWTVTPGEASARKADASAAIETPSLPVNPRPAAPRKLADVKSMVPLGTDRYVFIAKDRGKSRVFTSALDGRSVKQLDVPAGTDFAGFEQVLPISSTRLLVTYASDTGRQVSLGTDGTAQGTTQLTQTPVKRTAKLIAARSGRAVMLNNRDVIVTDGTPVGTTPMLLTNGDAIFLDRSDVQWAFINDRLILGSSVVDSNDSYDPEEVGGYVAPGSSSGSFTSVIVDYPFTGSTGSIAFDFLTSVANDVSASGIYSVQSAGSWGVISAGGKRPIFDDAGSNKSLKLIDGSFSSQGGLDTWRDAVVTAGRAVYSPRWDSRELWCYEPDTSSTFIRGRVISDATLPGRPYVGWQGLQVYADLNNDGRRNKNEPTERTDFNGQFNLGLGDAVVTGRQVIVRTFDYPGVIAPASPSVTVDVQPGRTRFVELSVRDVNPERIMEVDVEARSTTDGAWRSADGAIAYVDLDRDGRRDASEPFAVVAYSTARIRGVPLGRHLVRVEPSVRLSVGSPALSGREAVTTVQYEGRAYFREGLSYTPSARVRAAIFLDSNGNGAFDIGERDLLLPGTVFYVDLDNDGTRDASEPGVTVNADSTSPVKTLAELNPGSYTLRATVPASTGYRLSTTTNLFRLKGSAVTKRLPVAVPDGSIGGAAYLDDDENGAFTAGDRPNNGIGPVWVDLDEDGLLDPDEPHAFTGSMDSLTGRRYAVPYRFDHLPRRRVKLIRVSEFDTNESESRYVDLTAQRSVSAADFAVRVSTVKIGLYVDRNGDGQRQTAELAANVHIAERDQYGWRASRTGSDGIATMTGVFTPGGQDLLAGGTETLIGQIDAALAASRTVQWIAIPQSVADDHGGAFG